ncbi:MAG: ribosome biogenesis GTP-binding protein YihA/YsxC [Vampirovibrionales bacterium]
MSAQPSAPSKDKAPKRSITPLYGKFLTASPTLALCPEAVDENGTPLLEVVMVGRSNVGKSSLINALMGQKKLAHTSNTPGKTRLIQFYDCAFRMGEQGQTVRFRLVDLPGYGYAKVSKTMQAAWQKELTNYLAHREAIALVVQILDARHGLKENDQQMLEWLLQLPRIPRIVLNKSDQLNQSEKHKVAQAVSKAAGIPLPYIHLTHTREQHSQPWVWQAIAEALMSYQSPIA